MGFVRNTVLKTIIKQTLLDVTETIENFQRFSGLNSFGIAVEKWAVEQDYSDEFFNKQPWEGKFFLIINNLTSYEFTTKTGNQLETGKDYNILFKLVRNWILSLKGSESRLQMTIRDLG